jgi:hypothetical protein
MGQMAMILLGDTKMQQMMRKESTLGFHFHVHYTIFKRSFVSYMRRSRSDQHSRTSEDAPLEVEDFAQALENIRRNITLAIEDFRVATERKLDEIEANTGRRTSRSKSKWHP